MAVFQDKKETQSNFQWMENSDVIVIEIFPNYH